MRKLTESGLVKACLQYLALKKVPAWRNNAGAFVLTDAVGKRRRFRGGPAGSADILGVVPELPLPGAGPAPAAGAEGPPAGAASPDAGTPAPPEPPALALAPWAPPRRGVFLAVEVKIQGAKVSESQQAFLDAINGAGGLALVVTSLKELEDALRPGGA